MLRLVPLVRGQANGLSFPASLHFDPTHADYRITVASLRIGWTETADVEPDLEMADTLGFPSACLLISDDNIFGGYFDLPLGFGIKFVQQ